MSALRLVFVTLLAGALGAGCFDPLVGGECATGFDRCGHECVDLTASSDNCGGCNVRCSGGAACVSGQCTLAPGEDGGPFDAETVTPEDGAAGSGGSRDAGRDARANVGDGGAASDGGTTAGDGGTGDGGAGNGGTPSDGGMNAGADGGAGSGGAMDAGAPAPDGGADAPADADAALALDANDDAASAIDAPASSGDAPEPVDAPAADASVADASEDVAPPISCGDGGLILCGIECVDLDSDPDNCGVCGARCVSGFCVGGMCQGRTAGHLVVIGHDYTSSRVGMNSLLGNSVFLSQTSPVRVLALEGTATAPSIAGADSAINQVATQLGRSWTKTVFAASNLAASVGNADVVLIYAQNGSTDGTLQALAADFDWATTLRAFVGGGKTVIVLDGTSTNNAGTYQVLPATMFSASGHTTVGAGSTLTVESPGDAITSRVPLTYRAELNTVRFNGTGLTAPNVVVRTGGGVPIVLHVIFTM